MDKIVVVPDIHTRSFYKPVLQIKDTPIIFLGDYMCPYHYEGFTDKEGIEKLEEIIDFAKNNKNVTLLIGNHCECLIWSPMSFMRTSIKYYDELHKLYRDNIKLFKPCCKINDVIFTHAGINNTWIYYLIKKLKRKESSFVVNQDTICDYIENEFALELRHDQALGHGFYKYLESDIFDVGYSRGGDALVGGPFWSDFYSDYVEHPQEINCLQICGHQQGEITGLARFKDGIVCLDSRAIFEYDFDTHLVIPSELNDEKTKKEIPDYAWKGGILRFNPNIEEDK